MLPKIMDWCDLIDLPSLGEVGLSSLGFLFCHLVEKKKNSWIYWKKLYEIIKILEGLLSVDLKVQNLGPTSTDYLLEINQSYNFDALPLLPLELLMKAHEALGHDGQCVKQNHGEFLKFMISEMAKVFDSEELKNSLMKKEYAWVLANFDEEIDQCFHCLFGYVNYSTTERKATASRVMVEKLL